MIDYISSR